MAFNPYYLQPDSGGENTSTTPTPNTTTKGVNWTGIGAVADKFHPYLAPSIQGVTDHLGTMKETREYAQFDPRMRSEQIGMDGRPVYNIGQDAARINSYDPNAAGKGLVMSGIKGGASIGAGIGSVVPGIGTGIGAVAGGIIGGVTGAFQGGKRRREARKAKRQSMTNFSNAQQDFNRTNQFASQRQAMMSSYNRDPYNQNLFGIPRGAF